MFVLGLPVNLISISALEDSGWGIVFRSRHVLLYLVGVQSIEAVLLGDRKERLYLVQGMTMYSSSRWLPASGIEDEQFAQARVAEGVHAEDQPLDSDEQEGSLESTGRRLSQHRENEQDPEFRVVFQHQLLEPEGVLDSGQYDSVGTSLVKKEC
jgi:hypothetical protein